MTETIIIILLSALFVTCLIFFLLLWIAQKRSIKREQQNHLPLNISSDLSDQRVAIIKDLQDELSKYNEVVRQLKDDQSKDNSTFRETVSGKISDLQGKLIGQLVENKENTKQDITKFLSDSKMEINQLRESIIKQIMESGVKNNDVISKFLAESKEKIKELQTTIQTDIKIQNQSNADSLKQSTEDIQKKLDEEIKQLQRDVRDHLENIQKTSSDQIQDFIKKVAVLDETKTQMGKLGDQIENFKKILSDHKQRGTLGETLLRNVLVSQFGDNKELFSEQVKINPKSDEKADAVVKIGTEDGALPIAIDAKFPYDNYSKQLEDGISPEKADEFRKLFKRDLKERIKEISNKYIIDGVTAPYAIMFLPAETLIFEIYQQYPDVVTFSQEQRVIIVSPSLLIPVLYLLNSLFRNYRFNKNINQIAKGLHDILDEFETFKKRYDDIVGSLDTVQQKISNLNITVNKINKKTTDLTTNPDYKDITEDGKSQ